MRFPPGLSEGREVGIARMRRAMPTYRRQDEARLSRRKSAKRKKVPAMHKGVTVLYHI